MTEEWLERQEGPNGQYCDLLTRLPYERQRMIEALPPTTRPADIKDACLRALLWEAQVTDTLTGQMTGNIDRAAAQVIAPWRERAVELYNAWYAEAFPGPKDSTGKTGSQTPTTGRTSKRPETAEPEQSSDGSQEAP